MGVVSLIPPGGGAPKAFDDTDAAALGHALAAGWTEESAAGASARSAEAGRVEGLGVNTTLGQVKGAASDFLGGASLGLTTAIEAQDPHRREEQAAFREQHPYLSAGADIAGGAAGFAVGGALAGAGAAEGLAARRAAATAAGVGEDAFAASEVARTAAAAEAHAAREAGRGVVSKVARGAAKEAGIGGAIGFGSGVQELALSEEPVDVERVLSVLSSRALYGAAIGAGAGTVGKAAELGLAKARGALAEVAEKHATAAKVGEDLANMDTKGLQVAERTEKEALEAARVPQRKQLADELVTFRQEVKAQKQALTTMDVGLAADGGKLSSKELGKIAVKANRQLDSVLDNPIGLARNPAKALDALERQDNALSKILEREPEIRAAFAADTSGTRAAALDTIAPALERNRKLRQAIADLSSPAASERLTAIGDAKAALQAGSGKGKTLAEQMASGTAYGLVSDAVRMIPLPGMSLIAPMIGAKAASLVGEKVFGRIGAAVAEGQARSAAALDKLFAAGSRVVKASPPLATKILASVAFAPSGKADADAPATTAGKQKLPTLYTKRAAELREQVALGPTGAPVVRPAVRARIAASLNPIALGQPVLADKMETLAVKRLEFLASKLPKRPETQAMQIGPDRYQPSDMAMRTWARYVAAVEDPGGVTERLANGTLTPEDAEVMREVYPEQLAALTMQVLERLSSLRAVLSLPKRLALSMLTGVPVDASMDPRIKSVLQGNFAAESTPPKAEAQFGSVTAKSEPGTLSERREKGTGS